MAAAVFAGALIGSWLGVSRLPRHRLLQALAAQRTLAGEPLAQEELEVILLLNNCTDGSAATVARWRHDWPLLRVHMAEVTLPPLATVWLVPGDAATDSN